MELLINFDKAQTFTDKIKSAGHVGIGTDPLGNHLLGLCIPGYKGIMTNDAVGFRLENIGPFVERLKAGVTGNDPLEVAMDTMTVAEDGSVSFLLSRKSRSRTITLSAREAEEFADFLTMLYNTATARIEAINGDSEDEDSGDDSENNAGE